MRRWQLPAAASSAPGCSFCCREELLLFRERARFATMAVLPALLLPRLLLAFGCCREELLTHSRVRQTAPWALLLLLLLLLLLPA